MALYHFQAKIFTRAAGDSAIAKAAYRSGEALYDERGGLTHISGDRKRVAHTEILGPADAPEWARDRASLWNQVEAREKRKDSQLAREFELALPNELSLAQQLELLRGWVAAEITPAGAIADVAIHVGKDRKNPHAHLMTTMRAVSAEGWNRLKIREWEERSVMDRWRKSWADHTNAALELAAVQARVDHRSHAARGLLEQPTIKEGPGARGRAQRGQQSDRVKTNDDIRKSNEKRIRQMVEAIVAFAKIVTRRKRVRALGPQETTIPLGKAPQQPKAAAGPLQRPSQPVRSSSSPASQATQVPHVPPVTPPDPAPEEGLSDEQLAWWQQNGGRGRG